MCVVGGRGGDQTHVYIVKNTPYDQLPIYENCIQYHIPHYLTYTPYYKTGESKGLEWCA